MLYNARRTKHGLHTLWNFNSLCSLVKSWRLPGLFIFLGGVDVVLAADCIVTAGRFEIAEQLSEGCCVGEVRAATTFIGQCTAQSERT